MEHCMSSREVGVMKRALPDKILASLGLDS
jgi:hypothetical protein